MDKIIEGEIIIDFNIFIKKEEEEEKNSLFDQHQKNLERIINIFKDDEAACLELKNENIGYFAHKFFNKEFEGIYANIPNSLLYEEITKKEKFVADDFFNEKEKLADNCFKARGLSLEYYINDLINQNFKFIDLPRVIFCFKPLDSNNKIKDIIELDSIFYSQNQEVLDFKSLPFIDDDTAKKIDSSLQFEAGLNKIEFHKNSLNLFEIKNRFPSNKDKAKDNIKVEMDSLLEKTKIFHDLYKDRFKYEKIKILFFYDSVRKKGFNNIILNSLKDFLKKNKYLDNKIELQIIFITTSYFAIGVKSLNDKCSYLQSQIDSLQKEISELNQNIDNIKNQNVSLNAEIINLNNDNISLRCEIKGLREDNILLNNDNISLRREINRLADDNISLQNKLNRVNIEIEAQNEKMTLLNQELDDIKKKLK